MHDYLRAIGFSSIQTKTEFENILKDIEQNPQMDFITDDGVKPVLGEKSIDFGESSLGISKGKEQEMVDNQKCFTGELWKNEEKVWNDEKMRDRENLEDSWGETVLLSQGATKGPASLVSMEPGALATIYLDQELTVVGKMEQAADAVIPVDTVSRVHARIRKKDDGYYLADLNSRNGTSVNGRMLKPEEEYLLQNEDQVDFAKARYLFLK